jgi:hypothetical protein
MYVNYVCMYDEFFDMQIQKILDRLLFISIMIGYSEVLLYQGRISCPGYHIRVIISSISYPYLTVNAEIGHHFSGC